jgi:hypothetical protein
MIAPANGERGEVNLKIGGVDLVIAAEMKRLASLSTQLEMTSLQGLYQKLLGVEIVATMLAIQCLTVRGDVELALAKLKLKHFADCKTAFSAALAHHLKDDEGNEKAAASPAEQ